MSDGNGSMTDFGFADGCLAAADAVKKVTHVAIALVKAGSVVRQWFVQQLLLAGADLAAGDKNPTVGAKELDAIGRVLGISYYVLFRAGVFIHHRHRHTVGIFEFDLI